MNDLKKLMENVWNYSPIADPVRLATWEESSRTTITDEDYSYMYGFPLTRRKYIRVLKKSSKPGRVVRIKSRQGIRWS